MESLAVRLHQLFNQQRRFSFPFQEKKKEIPSNGIYIIFEKGETFQGMDRIIRVGTHTGDNQLFSRLNQHFLKENKNRSIFRKNIGRSLLHKENNPYSKEWEYDTTSREGKEKYAKLLNLELEKELEKRISTYIHENLSFVVFEVKTKEERLFWEERIIATLSKAANQGEIKPSDKWLGNFSP
ncbi:MAG: hypothetical protein D8H93_16195, partial [Capnocytophaga sp.]